MALTKLYIESEKGDKVGNEVPDIDLYFNPKEVSVDKNVPWQQQPDAKGDAPPVEFTTGSPKTMGFELLVDGWEKRKNVYNEFVSKLEKFVTIDASLKRPPMVTVFYASHKFKGVVESMNVKYTMFLEDGSPCRATVNLKFKQADKAAVKSSGGGGSTSANSAPPAGTTIDQSNSGRFDQVSADANGTRTVTSAEMRDTASRNNIDNMASVPEGTTISGGRR